MANTQGNINCEEDLFSFEKEPLALRGNKDYSEVLKHLVILCAQRKQAIKDYNRAVELKKEALADPSKVLEKIIKGEALGMPEVHCIPELPVIDWSKYNVKIPEEIFKLIYSDETEITKKKHELPKREFKHLHQKWTTEEQKRLEELLQIYPPEPIENHRFKKIAEALGTRTPQQVSSRVQKYFLKLYKAGLPIPGRTPKSGEKYKKTALHKHQRHNHYLFKPTTFFPDLCVPVVMNDLESVPGPSSRIPEDITQQSSNYLVPSGYHEENEFLSRRSETELQVELLKRIKKVKVKDEEQGSNLYSHIGFKCDYCGEEPIVGTRWHCNTCTADSIDFCTDCILAQLYSDNCHPLNHNLVSYSDRETNYLSDSESNTGSGVASLNKNNESSDSSDSEFNTEDVNDEEMNESLEQNKDQVISNGVEEMVEDNAVSEFNTLPKLDFGGYNENDELYDAGLGSDLFSEIDNISYNYLHSSLLLDKE